ncbi:MAG: nitronate monooxygenase [Candidatus Mcinerneyibacterium aminivorans]|uniref:Nitronate monooxygenase n=1 Tax=Candidatus Mcinerneyibacterium aminivorans TaxID=2703815 RepID=A0A5D0MBG0_9BACT|nr:MAG: nitronate monooxygenase [Candidatus Mcinerneyibacterium aminivorans]
MNLPKLKIGNLVAKLPVIQGGMGIGVSLSKLSSAVANEGGIGIISGAQTGFREKNFRTDNNRANVNGIIKEIKKARNLSPNGILGINILKASNNYFELVKTAVKEKIDLIISGAGLPIKLPSFVKNTKTKIVPIISSGRAAKLITKVWKKRYDYLPDAIVVEGKKAGGHLGFKKKDLDNNSIKPLKEIVKDVINVINPFEQKHNQKIPIIAAGGIYTGEDIKDFLEIGASGVQMATRFVAAEECDADIEFKKAYINATKEDICFIESPVGMPGRVIKNHFVEKYTNNNLDSVDSCYKCLKRCNPKTALFCITDALIKAVNGDTENGLIFIGENGYRVNKISTVKEIFEDIKKSFDLKKEKLNSLI